MNHFDGITPEQRWKNDVLNELREINRQLKEQQPAQESPKELIPMKRQYSKRNKGVS
ncbi:hypothetical protein [Paenibacillus riograndensis]|uniref:hypothetical protein n=1 Tax=Paenibacillus riograndensis TaxID=483937 RepID=UPI000B16278D|nr:hypothetical protein [Paenibacillus riograndensis]